MLRSRIAPTPSGYLHIGNALNFVITWLWVRREEGQLRLRIDDRSTPVVQQEYLQDIFSTLEWLGLDWDKGPRNAEEQRKIYSQHLQGAKYNSFIDRIIATGQVFACTCNRKTMQGVANEQCNCRVKNIPLHQADVTWRVITPANTIINIPDAQRGSIPVELDKEMHDFPIRRRDGIAAYQVVSLCDDVEHETNLIIRGTDLLPSAAAQMFLAELIGEKSFAQSQFYHHPVVNDADGEKLSKSAGSKAIKSWGPETSTTADFYEWVGKMLGWAEPVTSFDQMLRLAKEGKPLFLHS